MNVATLKVEAVAGHQAVGTLYGIQHLRFVAAMMVVVTHAFMRAENLYPDWIVSKWSLGAAGVDIFFVISGFIMVLITKDRPPQPVGFWLGRVFRIVPLYWAATLLAVFLGLMAPAFFTVKASGGDILQSLLFFRTKDTLPIIRPGWTLNLEMTFYSMLSIALFARRAYIPVVLFMLFAFYCAATILSKGHPFFAYYSANGFLLQFGLGILLAMALERDHGIKPVWGFPIVILGFVLLYFMWPQSNQIGRFFTAGVPAFLIVGGAVLIEPYCRSALSKRLSVLGDASYAIYVTHTLLVIGPIYRLARRNEAWADVPVAPLAVTALLIILPIIVGVATHLYFERPVARWIKQRRRRTSPARLEGGAVSTR